jgi:hypothetical protein
MRQFNDVKQIDGANRERLSLVEMPGFSTGNAMET